MSAHAQRPIPLTAALGGTGVAALPKFSANMSGNQTITTATMTKVAFDTEVFDTNSNYDSATNYRFTPTVVGKYLIGVQIYYGTTVSAAGASVFIRKNGADYARVDQRAGVAAVSISGGSVLVDMNGSTDYVEAWVYQDSGSDKTITAGASITQFWGTMIP